MAAEEAPGSASAVASKPTSPTMKSWRVTASGEPAKVLQFGDVPVPRLKKGDILVKVQAAALNPV